MAALLSSRHRPAAGDQCYCEAMRWVFPEADRAAVDTLRKELGIPSLAARVLALRGYADPASAAAFLLPALGQLLDPFLMRDVRAAVERLKQAIRRKEKVLIYGDYDVDGTMAAVVLLTALRSLGATVEAHIPDRHADGYGMRARVMERAAQEGFRVVISVDNGIREHEALSRAQELGIDCIVTDHHLPGPAIPPAIAILNPHQPHCSYPDKNLSGVGVAFKLAQALLGTSLSDKALRSYLKLVAIGSIADVVPLRGENRTMAHFGLAGLSESAGLRAPRSPGQTGLRALLAVAGLDGKPVSAGDVAFRIAPRLNAAGRMLNARDVIDLFTQCDPTQTQEIAGRLEMLNRRRQSLEEAILAEIAARAERATPIDNRYSLVFCEKAWHRGVIGIVAQRLVDLYHRPTLVIAVEDGVGYGSGRSIAGFHLFNALSQAKELFTRFGGHASAAGFTLPALNVPQLEEALERHARSTLTAADLEPSLRIDAVISLREITWELFRHLREFEPFGFGNPAPVFAAKVEFCRPSRVFKEKHLKTTVREAGRSFEVVGWGMAKRAPQLAGQGEIAFTLAENNYRGETSLELVLKDVRPMQR
ncbi:MAG: single-stranded-DNA-specific exonuclease RecJ [Terriglobia bacterium]